MLSTVPMQRTDIVMMRIRLHKLSCVMRKLNFAYVKTEFCICENKGTDQVCSDCAADQPLCFHYIDSIIPLLSKSETSKSLAVQQGLGRACLQPRIMFSCNAA